MTTRHVHHALSLTLTAMAARLPGTVWAVLLGGIFILACTTTPPETLAPTDEPRAEITATLPAGMADPTSTPESDSIGSLALLETLPGPPLSPDAIATWSNAVVRVEGDNGSGTGFIIAREEKTAYIVTAMHVVDSEEDDHQVSSHIKVITRDGLRFDAAVVGHKNSWDLAVLAICCSDSFAVIPWESGREGVVGQQVITIGYTDSYNNLTITHGNIIEGRSGDLFYHDAFQNPGNSGSPLLATDGSILGINIGTLKTREAVFVALPYDPVFEEVRRWMVRFRVLPDPARAEEASPPPGKGGGPDDIGDPGDVFGDPDDDIGDDPPLPETVESAGFTFVCEDLFSADELRWTQETGQVAKRESCS